MLEVCSDFFKDVPNTLCTSCPVGVDAFTNCVILDCMDSLIQMSDLIVRVLSRDSKRASRHSILSPSE